MVKILILLVLLYFIMKAAGNMLQAVLHDPKAQGAVPPPRGTTRQAQPQEPTWRGPEPRRTPPAGDVEDAKWVDL